MGLTEMNIRMNGWEAKERPVPRARLEDLGLPDSAKAQLPHIGTVMIVGLGGVAGPSAVAPEGS